MSRTLEQAIEHAEQVAAEQSEKAKTIESNPWGERSKVKSKIQDCLNCAAEHRQLAAWLRELKERRKAPEIIRCGECRHKGTKNCVANTWATIFGYEVKDDFYCGLAERRTE